MRFVFDNKAQSDVMQYSLTRFLSEDSRNRVYSFHFKNVLDLEVPPNLCVTVL